MPRQEQRTFVRQSQELVRQSKHLCDASRERIERAKRLREEASELSSRADDAKRTARNEHAALRRIEMPATSARLISEANAASIGFLNTELDTGLSFVRMAARIGSRKKVRPHDTQKMKRYLGYARQAYDTVSSHIGSMTGKREELRAINEKVAELRKSLECS